MGGEGATGGTGDGVRTYLRIKLDRTPSKDKLSRAMLSSWLLEAFLAHWDEVEDQQDGSSVDDPSFGSTTTMTTTTTATTTSPKARLVDETSQIQTSLFHLLETQADVLPRTTVYQLARSHARPEVLLRFAHLAQDARTTIGYFLEQDDWNAVLRTLASQEEDLELY